MIENPIIAPTMSEDDQIIAFDVLISKATQALNLPGGVVINTITRLLERFMLSLHAQVDKDSVIAELERIIAMHRAKPKTKKTPKSPKTAKPVKQVKGKR